MALHAIADRVLHAMNSQPLAYLMPEFLASEEARPIRILAEYFEPLRRFRAQNIQDTVVFFGSARTRSRRVRGAGAGGASGTALVRFRG